MISHNSLTTALCKINLLLLIILPFVIINCGNTNSEEFDYYYAKKGNRIEQLRHFINKYPDSKYKENIKELLYVHELKDYENAKKEDSIDSLEKFLVKWPDGKYKSQAQERLGLHELKDYEAAKKENSIDSLNRFFINWPNGKYKSQAEDIFDDLLFIKINIDNTANAYEMGIRDQKSVKYDSYYRDKRQDALYNETISSKNIDHMRYYLRQYPNGKHKEIIAKLLKEETNKLRKLEQKETEERTYKNALQADSYFQFKSYLKYYPNGEYVKDIRQRISKLKRSKKAIVEVIFPKVIEGDGEWEWETIFREKGGKIGYSIKGEEMYIQDKKGRIWGPHGSFGDRSLPGTSPRFVDEGKFISPGGEIRSKEIIRSSDHGLCNGYYSVTWKGEDDAGHQIKITEKIYLKHTGCTGSKKIKTPKKVSRQT